MNTLVSLFALAIVLLAKASQVNMMPVQSVDSSNATNISTITTLNRSVNAILHQLVGATQGIQFLLTQNETVRPFEYCFLPLIANPPSTNLTIEDRLLIDYQILNKLTTPLRDVVNYEGRIRNNNINDLNLYQKVAWAWEQLNTSLEEIQKIQNSPQLMQQLSHLDLLSQENHQFISNNSTSNNTTMSQDRCKDIITNSTDVFRDLFEIHLGLHFAVLDLFDILT